MACSTVDAHVCARRLNRILLYICQTHRGKAAPLPRLLHRQASDEAASGPGTVFHRVSMQPLSPADQLFGPAMAAVDRAHCSGLGRGHVQACHIAAA